VSGPGGGSVADPRDIEDWACRMSERLPTGDVRRLAQAALAGEPGVPAASGSRGSTILRDACDQLQRRLA
jgi:hypothetical protein